MASNHNPKADDDTPRLEGVSVCWPWKTDNAPELPTTLPVPPVPNTNISSLVLAETRFNLFSPVNSNAASASAGASWLARMAHLGSEESTVLNPFNHQDYMLCSPPVTGEISLSDCNVVEVARSWSLLGKLHAAGNLDTVSKKVVGGWNVQSGYGFAVLVQLKDREECGLLFFRLHDNKWVAIGERMRTVDIACYNGKFYAFQIVDWKVGVIDPEKDSISMEFIDAPGVLLEPIDNAFCVSIDGCSYAIHGVYFAACETGLYLVIRSVKVGSDKVVMMVFNLIEVTGEWERVAILEDEILFIGYDVSFGVLLENLPNWNPGSICLFTRPFPIIYDACLANYRGLPLGAECLSHISFPEYWRYLSIYNMDEEEKGIVPFEKLPMEKYTGLFFPPPSWVKWRCPSLDNAEVKLHNITFTLDDD